MTKNWVQHIGDDQLVYGMPKRMVGVSTQESLAKFKKAEADYERVNKVKIHNDDAYYWTVHPKPKACEKCQDMAGKKFMKKPDRPHPNCKCEFKKHPKIVSIYGSLNGYDDRATESFVAGNSIEIEVRNVWLGLPGVYVYKDGTCVWSTGHLVTGKTYSKTLYKDGEYPVDWEVKIWSRGADNCRVDYFIRG